MDGSGNEISLDMNIEITKTVSFNNCKHVPAGSNAGGKTAADLTVNVTGGIMKYASVDKVTVKNNKAVSVSSSKKPQVIIVLKASGADKAVKKSVSDINKSLKKEPLTFEIVPLDLSWVKDSIKAKTNGKKTKITKLSCDVPVGGGTKNIKLSKKDYTVDSITDGVDTITGKKNCSGSVTIPVN